VEAPLTTIRTVVRAPRVRPYDLSLQLSPRKQLVALRGGPHPVAVQLSAQGKDVRIDVLSRGALDDEDVQRAIDDAVALAGLDDDPGDFADVARRHPLVEKMHDHFAGARLGRLPTVWQAFATSVVEQLVTFGEAQQAVGRMRAKFGLRVAEGCARSPPPRRSRRLRRSSCVSSASGCGARPRSSSARVSAIGWSGFVTSPSTMR
jgi:3-methyladenine DNA glycosylase/8-oxoguanine DNA glycosylase